MDNKALYDKSFKDELEKIAKYGRRRRRKQSNSWKTKFASDLKIRVNEYDIGDRMAKGFAKILTRKGL